LKFIRYVFPLISISGRWFDLINDRPLLSQFGIDGDELLLVIRKVIFGKDGGNGAFWLAEGAVDAFLGVDDEKIRPFMKAVDRADINAVGIFALDTIFSNDKGHGFNIVVEILSQFYLGMGL
jgi:hypothetical protein